MENQNSEPLLIGYGFIYLIRRENFIYLFIFINIMLSLEFFNFGMPTS